MSRRNRVRDYKGEQQHTWERWCSNNNSNSYMTMNIKCLMFAAVRVLVVQFVVTKREPTSGFVWIGWTWRGWAPGFRF